MGALRSILGKGCPRRSLKSPTPQARFLPLSPSPLLSAGQEERPQSAGRAAFLIRRGERVEPGEPGEGGQQEPLPSPGLSRSRPPERGRQGRRCQAGLMWAPAVSHCRSRGAGGQSVPVTGQSVPVTGHATRPPCAARAHSPRTNEIGRTLCGP